MLLLFLLVPILESLAAEETKKLLMVNVLFRHGARAPSAGLSNSSFERVFSNGIGEMTEEGILTSVELGRFLGQRYVANGFLRVPMKPSEVYFRSMNINRCLITASAVGSGMFSRDGVPAFVPVYSHERNETVLMVDRVGCRIEDDRVRAICPDAPSINTFRKWPEFEGMVYECFGFHRNSSRFHDAREFTKAESLIKESLSGLHNTDDFSQIKEELFASYLKVFNFIIGAAEYRNESILKYKGGRLLHEIKENFMNSWNCHLNTCAKQTKKFIAYSTQDWLIGVILESLGVREPALGESWPEFNSLIVIELWEVEAVPMIKLFYKRGVKSPELVDLTSLVPTCRGRKYCNISDFLSVFGHLAAPTLADACPRYSSM